MNPRVIARFLGLLLLVEAAFMATSILWALADWDMQAVTTFVIASGLTALAGMLGVGYGKKPSDYITAREAVSTVALGWIAVGVFGAVPFLLEGAFDHPSGALFESVSGFTTTGASALTNVESLTRSLMWW